MANLRQQKSTLERKVALELENVKFPVKDEDILKYVKKGQIPPQQLPIPSLVVAVPSTFSNFPVDVSEILSVWTFLSSFRFLVCCCFFAKYYFL